jgi:hypothetical protein
MGLVPPRAADTQTAGPSPHLDDRGKPAMPIVLMHADTTVQISTQVSTVSTAHPSMSGGSMAYTYSLNPEAYTLPILHAASHLSSTVIGLFLGSFSDGASTSTSTSTPTSPATKTVKISHALPLQHLYTSLSPFTELGLELASAYAEKNGLRVVGIYIARGDDAGSGSAGSSNGNGSGGSGTGTAGSAVVAGQGAGTTAGLGRVGERLLGKLREGFEGAFALSVSPVSSAVCRRAVHTTPHGRNNDL